MSASCPESGKSSIDATSAKSRVHGTVLARRNRLVVPVIPGATAHSNMRNEAMTPVLVYVTTGSELRDSTRHDPFILLFRVS